MLLKPLVRSPRYLPALFRNLLHRPYSTKRFTVPGPCPAYMLAIKIPAPSTKHPKMFLSTTPGHVSKSDDASTPAPTLSRPIIPTTGYVGDGEGKWPKLDSFCTTGDIPTKIKVWYNKEYIKGVEIFYTDFPKLTMGDVKGHAHKEFMFEGDEKILDMQIQARSLNHGCGLGMIWFKTNSSNPLKKDGFCVAVGVKNHKPDTAGKKGYNGNPIINPSVGGGYLCGMYGSYGSNDRKNDHKHFTQFGFHFMGKIQSITVLEEPKPLSEQNFFGSRTNYCAMHSKVFWYTDKDGSLDGAYIVDTKDSATITWGKKITYGLGFDLKFPVWAAIGLSFNFEIETDKVEEKAKVTSYRVERSIKIPISAMSWSYTDVTYEHHYANNMPFKAILRVKFENGDVLTPTITGNVSYAAFTDAEVRHGSYTFGTENPCVPTIEEAYNATPPLPPWRTENALDVTGQNHTVYWKEVPGSNLKPPH